MFPLLLICFIEIGNIVYNVENLQLYLQKKQFHVNYMHTLSLARSNHVSVEGFYIDEINLISDYIATGGIVLYFTNFKLLYDFH